MGMGVVFVDACGDLMVDAGHVNAMIFSFGSFLGR
jgi:hypothetical protein